MNSLDTNHILNDNKNLGQYDQNAIPPKIMPYYSYPASLVYQNEIPVDRALMTWTGTNYVLNEHEDVDQYGSFAMSSRKIPY